MKIAKTKVFILGAGAGGFGAAYRLSKKGVPFVICDRNQSFGGNAVFGGVSCFEPGVSLDGVHYEIAKSLLKNGEGEVQYTFPQKTLFIFSGNTTYSVPPPYPWGFSAKVEEPYEQTLKECLQFYSGYQECRRFMTDEDALRSVMEELIDKKYCTSFFGYEYKGLEIKNGNISSVTISNGDETVTVYADFFMDCSGSIVLARDAGCEYEIGDAGGDISGVNGVSFVFRVSKNNALPEVTNENLPEDTKWVKNKMEACVSAINSYPNGDLNFNMLPTMTGEEWLTLADRRIEVGRSRVFSYWNYFKKRFLLDNYKIIKLFSPGIREDYRLIGKKVLQYEDIIAPFDENKKFLAIADHSVDIHGVKNAISGAFNHPYGIPLECAMTKEFSNLFVACRGASFSHTVASSARLTRTMISMGENTAEYIIDLVNQKSDKL